MTTLKLRAEFEYLYAMHERNGKHAREKNSRTAFETLFFRNWKRDLKEYMKFLKRVN